MREIPEPLLFELSRPGRLGVELPTCDVPEQPRESLLPAAAQRRVLPLPELSEPEVIRHFTHLSQRNYSTDSGFYPLGSCTMKYNPKLKRGDRPAARLLPASTRRCRTRRFRERWKCSIRCRAF